MRTAVLKSPIGDVMALLPKDFRELPGGTTLWFQRRQDDCFRAAVATVTGIPYDDVPDWDCTPGTHAEELALHAEVVAWAGAQGFKVGFHNTPPDAGPYLAVSPAGDDRYRHVLAVIGGVAHDPGSGFVWPREVQVELSPTQKVEYAMTFERTTQ